MSDKTGIEWTDATWNIVSGCTRVSAGCDHCYIARTPPFRMAHRKFDGEGPGSTTGVLFNPERFAQPTRWRTPRRVFVNSLADLFHDEVSTEYIAETFGVMGTCAAHTFQILTKRPGRMKSLLNSHSFLGAVLDHQHDWMRRSPSRAQHWPGLWPLPNVHLGVSVEDQKWTSRIDLLRRTPAAVRFISAEPLLGPLALHRYLPNGWGEGARWNPTDGLANQLPTIDWVIVGGESGPGSRPMHPEWARSLRDQCESAGVPFLFKQWGEYQPSGAGIGALMHPRFAYVGEPDEYGWRQTMERVGKKAAGRELDGRTWDEYPDVSA